MFYHYGKRVLAFLFVLFLIAAFAGSSAYLEIGEITNYLKQQGKDIIENRLDVEPTSSTMQSMETAYADSFWQKRSFINFNGRMAKMMHMQGYYSNTGIYVMDDGFIVSPYAQTSTDYEYDEIVSFKRYLDQKGIHLIYVNEPVKYMDDSFFAKKYGVESYTNRNADLFLQRILEAGIHTIDLREELVQDGLSIRDMFYRTDHHWTTKSGLWAAGKIAEGLNKYCDYAIDTSVFDESKYLFQEWKNCWLGEQGRKIAATYVGLDDYTKIKPDFATSYTFKKEDGMVQGTFDDFIAENVYDTEVDVYSAPSWHYSYALLNTINNNVEDGKILVLGDSFEHVVVPFLSLGVSKIDTLILRSFSGKLREYIDAGDYDTVLICYTQSMIGEHDNPQSANYNMFTFD